MAAGPTSGAVPGGIVNRSAQEHLSYIQEKVNPVLEALVTAVLLERPDDPAYFMLKWLCEQTKTVEGGQNADEKAGSSSEEIRSVRDEIEKLKARKTQLLAKKGGAETRQKADDKEAQDDKGDDDEDEEEEEDDDDDGPDEPPPPPPSYNRGPRQSVSAEAYGDWNKKGEFKAPVYDKSDDQKQRIKDVLAKSFLFSTLEAEEMNTVLLAFKEKLVKPQEMIIKQGDDGESMFLIEKGQVDCFKKIDGEDKVVKTCGSGDVFGELALLYNCPRAASVVAKEETTLWELDRETFNRIVKDSAQMKRDMYTDFLKKIPLFNNIDQYEVMTIADALNVEKFEQEGECILQQGATGDKFYMVLEGECIAKKSFVSGQDPRKVMTHKESDYFGELALLENAPRAASVHTNSTVVRLLSMERKTFKRLLGPIEDILRRETKRYETADAAATA